MIRICGVKLDLQGCSLEEWKDHGGEQHPGPFEMPCTKVYKTFQQKLQARVAFWRQIGKRARIFSDSRPTVVGSTYRALISDQFHPLIESKHLSLSLNSLCTSRLIRPLA